MTKILFDNQIFLMQDFGGVSRYFAELLKGLNESPDFSSLPDKLYSSNKHLRLNGMTYFNHFASNVRFRGKVRIENFFRKKDAKLLLKNIKKGEYDIFHPTYYDTYFFNSMPAGKPFVLTVYDMIHELYYEGKLGSIQQETLQKRALIPRASHIVAISQNTKDDILRYFPEVDEQKISVIYLGSSFSASGATEISMPSRYILYVGNRNYYKNFTWFFQSIAGLLQEQDLMLVCAGGGKFTEMEEALIDSQNLGKKVHHVPVSGDSDLAGLYKAASCFVFPSLYEGFGIPILEAFSCSCPTILPDSSCFPEIAGDAALYYKSGDSNELVAQINRVINEPELSQTLRTRGNERLKIFNWENTVKQHMNLYESILSA